jgi:hypothetical protein
MDYKRNWYRIVTKETTGENCVFKRAVKISNDGLPDLHQDMYWSLLVKHLLNKMHWNVSVAKKPKHKNIDKKY